MGVFMVVRAGAALVSRISQMLVSYRWAPTMVPSSYLVQITDAGSVPCSTLGDKWPKRWTFGQKQGQLFRLRRGIEPCYVLFPDAFVPAHSRLRRGSRALDFLDDCCSGVATHTVVDLPCQDRWQ